MQQELVEAISTTTRAQEAEALKDRQIAALREEQLQKDTINEWNSADTTVGPIPYLQSREVLKDLARCFTNRSNP